MRKFAVAVAVLGLALCSRTARAEDIDNPAYQAWSKFKVGTYVTQKMESDMGGNKSETEMTTTLVELTADHCVLEIKMSMMMGGKKTELPAQKGAPIPAKVKKPEGGKEGDKPKEGKDSVEINGKKLDCKTYEMDTEANGMKTHTKTWISDEIPGGIPAKSESTMTGSMKGTSKSIVTKFEKK